MKRFALYVGIAFTFLLTLLPFAGGAQAQDDLQDIVDTAVAAEDFNTLVAAVQAADLVNTLKGEGPFTVFAPTDAAFAALPEGTIETLLADPAGDLTQILLYHVIAGKVMAADLSNGMQAETVQGSPVTFTLANNGAMVNDANIVVTDIEASNGVIHVIDAVILPPSPQPEVLPVTGSSQSYAITIVAVLMGLVVLVVMSQLSRRGLA